MKFAGLLMVLSGCAQLLHAQVYADISTNNGTFTVRLNHTQTPQTVANFVSLAEGTRSFVDSRDGSVRKGPFYQGIKIHRTENSAGFKILQAGSIKGDGSDGPGFEIRDEIVSGLTHQPYVISMAHSGPNTNGSQFFVTGSTAIASLDGLHTVFGDIPDSGSRAVVDTIISAGANNTTIQSVIIRRVGSAAESFNPLAQGLPEVLPCKGNLVVAANGAIAWNVSQPSSGLPASCIYSLHGSQNLQNWSYYGRLYRGQDSTSAVTSINLGNATLPKLFFQMSQVNYFPAYAPTELNNRVCLIALSTGILEFQINSAGNGGICYFTENTTGTVTNITFQLYTNFTRINPYSFTFAVSDIPSGVFGTSVPYQVKCGCDSATAIQVDGHYQSFYFHPVFGWLQDELGAMAIER
jgi:peptidyl-prolyl cis-trans isomerase A (cyclophilin A)